MTDPAGAAPVRGLALVPVVLAYVLTGGLLGAIGSFSLPTPVLAAVIGIVAVPALVLLAVWLSGRVLAGLAAYGAWLAVVIVFTMPRHFDSAVISGTASGDAFVYGGSGTGVAAVALAPLFTVRLPHRPGRRSGPSER